MVYLIPLDDFEALQALVHVPDLPKVLPGAEVLLRDHVSGEVVGLGFDLAVEVGEEWWVSGGPLAVAAAVEPVGEFAGGEFAGGDGSDELLELGLGGGFGGAFSVSGEEPTGDLVDVVPGGAVLGGAGGEVGVFDLCEESESFGRLRRCGLAEVGRGEGGPYELVGCIRRDAGGGG